MRNVEPSGHLFNALLLDFHEHLLKRVQAEPVILPCGSSMEVAQAMLTATCDGHVDVSSRTHPDATSAHLPTWG